MNTLTLAECHQILSKPEEKLTQIELGISAAIFRVYGEKIEKFALYAKLATELDEHGASTQQVKI